MIDGRAFSKWLGAAAKKLQREVARAVLRTGEAAATYARLTRLHKNHTYKLRASIKPQATATEAKVTADAPYAFYVENGTRPHSIAARRKQFLRFEMNGEIVFRRRVYHPGTEARPFMREAQERATPLFSRLVTEAATNAFK